MRARHGGAKYKSGLGLHPSLQSLWRSRQLELAVSFDPERHPSQEVTVIPIVSVPVFPSLSVAVAVIS